MSLQKLSAFHCAFMLHGLLLHVMLHDKPSGHHGRMLLKNPSDYLQYVNDDEPDEGKTGDKVNRPRRLPSTEIVEQPGERRIDRCELSGPSGRSAAPPQYKNFPHRLVSARRCTLGFILGCRRTM